MRICGKVVKEGFTGGSKLLGLDMEGSYIKDPVYGGAQDPKYFMEPDIAYFDRLNKLSGHTIKRVLIAPEWGASAIKLIKHVIKEGAVAGVGHAGCSYDKFMKAYHAGVKVLVHFGNGPMSQNFKGGGILDAAFALGEKITPEIIIDNCHINPRWTSAFLKTFNFNVVGITDALFFAGAPKEASEFKFGDFNVVVKNGAAWVKEKKDTLCGSCITMDTAFENFLNIIVNNEPGYLTGKLFEKNVSLDTAIGMTSKLVSYNPAKLYGFDAEIGTLEIGKKADVLIMDVKETKGRYNCALKSVFINGEVVK